MPYRYTASSSQPKGPIQYAGRQRLTKEQQQGLANDVRLAIQAGLDDADAYQRNLPEWNAIYEVLTTTKNWPWQNSANVRPGALFLATQLESLVAYVVNRTLVPRLFLVTGLDDDGARKAPTIERYLNSELFKPRGPDGSTWYDKFTRWPHLAARDGIGYMQALWRTTKTQQRIVQFNPRMITVPGLDQGPDVQAPDVDEEGQPQFDKVEQIVDIDEYDDVELSDVSSRNLFPCPAAATSIENAMGWCKVEYLYEEHFTALLNDESDNATFYPDAIELALSYVPIGVTELPASQQPLETFTAGGQLQLGQGQGAQVSKFFKNRGPIECYVYFSRQYDLDGDNATERNVFFVHAQSWTLLGWMRYEYFINRWPFFGFAMLPRPDTMIGFSVIERGLPTANEIDALRQQRLDEGSLRVSPPRWVRKGSDLEDEGMAWGPNETWTSGQPDDFQIPNLPPVPPDTLQDIMLLKQDFQEYTGLSNPMVGQMNTGRRSAAEVRQIAAASATRLDLIVMRQRIAIRQVINFIFELKKQFMTKSAQFQSQGKPDQMPLDFLNANVQIDVAGASDPADAATRFNELIAVYDVAMTDPAIANDPQKRFAWIRMLLEAKGLPNLDQLIGNEQEAQQQKQQQLQQAMQQMQGQPGQNGQQGQAPQGPPGGGRSQAPAGGIGR